MTYTEEKKAKISKYCYRMNKACGQRDIGKVSEYFGHLKYHVMTGGAVIPQEIQEKINGIQKSIELINGSAPLIKTKINDLESKNSNQKTEINRLENVLFEKKNQIDELNKKIKDKEAEISSHLTGNTDAKAAYEELLKEKTDKETEIIKLNSKIDELKKNMSEYIGSITENVATGDFNKSRTSIENAGEAKGYLENLINAIQGKITELEKEKNQALQKLDIDIKAAYVTNGEKVKNLEDEVNTQRGDINIKAEEIKKLMVELNTIKANAQSQLDKISLLEKENNDKANEITELSGAFDNIQNQLSGLQATVNDLVGTTNTPIVNPGSSASINVTNP